MNYVDKNCEHFCAQYEYDDVNKECPVIWCCNLMIGEKDHEGNCGQYECPLGKKKEYWAGCNFYENTGKNENEPKGTATSMHPCGKCDKLDNCDLKKETDIWKLED